MGRRRWSLLIAAALVVVALPLVASSGDAIVRVDELGMVDPTTGQWHLRNDSGGISTFYFGNPGDCPFVGDWDCNGVDTPGLYRQSDGYAYLRNSNTQGIADIKFYFGNPGDVPIAGDFNGDGCDTVSIYRPSNQTFYIINKLGSNDGGLGAADFSYVFGNPGDKPFVGDFDGDGIESVGLHRESTGLVYFRNSHTTGIAENEFIYGDPGDRLVAGDWTGNGFDSPGLFRPSSTTWYLRWSNTQGTADESFVWGQPAWLPVAGEFGQPNPSTSTTATTTTSPIPSVLSPELVSAARLSPDQIDVGDELRIEFEVSDGTSPTTDVVFRYADSSGLWRYVGGTATDGLATEQIPSGWVPGPYTLQHITVYDSENRYITYYSNGSTDHHPPGMGAPASHSLDFSALEFTLGSAEPPDVVAAEVVQAARTSPGVVEHGDQIAVGFTAQDGTSQATSVHFRFADPTGLWYYVTGDASTEVASRTIEPGWIVGNYTLLYITVYDEENRSLTYQADGTTYWHPPGMSAPGTHAFDFADFAFRVE